MNRITTRLLLIGLIAGFMASSQTSEASGGGCPAGMVLIPAGRYTVPFLGQRDPKQIGVKSFCLDVVPVTNGDFLDFVRANPKWRRSQIKPASADEGYLKLWLSDLEPGPAAPSTRL